MINTRQIIFTATIALTIMTSCHRETKSVGDDVIVSVYDRNLKQDELDNYIPDYFMTDDSIEAAETYIRTWIDNELIYHYARERLKDTSEIAKKVDAYRKDLFRYEMETQYLNMHLDTVVSPAEIDAYYKEHLGEYKLEQMAVKAHYITMDVKVQTYYYELDKVRRSTPENMEELYDAGKRTNIKVVEHRKWMFLSDLLQEINASKTPQIEQGLQIGYFFTEDEEHRYIVKINEKKLVGDTVPVDLISKDIRSIIMNQRKDDLLRSFTNDLFQDAKSKQAIVYKEN